MTEEPSAQTATTFPRGSSPYATGGGGFALEHAFGATLLGSLLLSDSVPGLGDEYTVVELSFQSQLSPVDDVVVTGEVRGQGITSGTRRIFAIAIRRDPQIAPSSTEFVNLLSDYLRAMYEHWAEIQDGTWRLGLAVSTLRSGLRELSSLAEFAQTQTNAQSFRNAVLSPGRTTAGVRRRLGLFEDAVQKSAALVGISEFASDGIHEVAWRVLRGLYVLPLDIEGTSSAGRTAIVNQLRSIVGEAGEADSLFRALYELATRYDSSGAVVDDIMVRRDLSGMARLQRSLFHQEAWRVLDALAGRLRARTGRELISNTGGQRLALERKASRDSLAARMKTAASSGVPLVVFGQPDVGKSSLTVAASEALAADGAEITAISLRDLPSSVADLIHLLGAPLREVLGSQSVAPVRLLVMDGAEAVIEDHYDILADLAAAARSSGTGLVAVTRSDARERVVEALTLVGAGLATSPSSLEVEGLSRKEGTEVVGAFPALARLADEPRSAWLLTRVGLIALLLTADAVSALPNGALSEADVFAAVWSALVRRGERNEPGRGSADGREFALLNLARRSLISGAAVQLSGDPAALPSLRSDGLLLAPDSMVALGTGDQFATDLIRDFAVARLLRCEGWQILKDAGVPRWALRAARLACQARLELAGAAGERARVELQTFFDALATEHGDRWADVPLEAMLTLGNPCAGLENAWPSFVGQQGEGLERLLRLVLQRYRDADIADPVLVRPVVQLLMNHEDELTTLPCGIRDAATETKICWLRGLAVTGKSDVPDIVRAQLRDLLLAAKPEPHDGYIVESLALLGPDLDPSTRDLLQRLAVASPWLLAPCVESGAVAVSMATHHPELLLQLAEAYYVDRSRAADGYPRSAFDDGIRGHRSGGGFGIPLAAWYRGPFWQLMRARPGPTLAFINRMLDRAARVQIRTLHDLGSSGSGEGMDEPSMPAMEVDIPGIGPRRFVGDSHAWSWYRGSSVGPSPCMSALMAVERYFDQAHAAGILLQVLTTIALQDCHNLAIPGLVVGFLVRHPEDVTNELDAWLAEPSVWELEFGRATLEGQFHVQGPDPDDLHGRDLRRWSLREVAYVLTVRALMANDTERLVELNRIADELVNRVASRVPSSVRDGDERLAAVKLWAGILRSQCYKIVELENGSREVHYMPPEVGEAHARKSAELARTQQVMHLLAKYTTDARRRPTDIGDLGKDLRVAMDLSADPPAMGQHFAADAFGGVAATALIAFGEGKAKMDDNALKWAVSTVAQVALAPRHGLAHEINLVPWGADRSAALAVSTLLLPAFNENGPEWFDEDDREIVADALRQSFSSMSIEVRRFSALGLEPIWKAPCSEGAAGTSSCRHRVAFAAIEAAARRCQLGGPFDSKSQRRQIKPIEGPLAQAIDAVPAKALFAEHLAAPLLAACECAASSCCAANDALPLRDALLRAYIRGYVLRVEQGYDVQAEQDRRLIAGALLNSAGSGDDTCLRLYLEGIRNAPGPLASLLRDLAGVATYEEMQRRNLRAVWPLIMGFGLEALATKRGGKRYNDHQERRDYESALAVLLPAPQLRMEDRDPDRTLDQARADWINVESLAALVPRWISLAAGIPECVDNLVGVLQTTPPEFQATLGFDWVAQTVASRYEEIATRSWLLTDWLRQVRASGRLDSQRLVAYERLVDGLAAHGSQPAVRLQESFE